MKNRHLDGTNVIYKEEVLDKLLKQKDKYRIINNIDNISVQYVELFDYIKKEDKDYIKVYLSIYFYDNVKNNFENQEQNDKYWNDIWIVTYGRIYDSVKRKRDNCYNCGAVMKYNKNLDIFECEYCGNTV